MAPRKKGEKKGNTEEVMETKEPQHSGAGPSDGSSREEKTSRKRKIKPKKKYIGAHVSISGEHTSFFSKYGVCAERISILKIFLRRNMESSRIKCGHRRSCFCPFLGLPALLDETSS